jgi:hypothetical protein
MKPGMTTILQPVYSERVVAFIDILGFGALVQQLGTEAPLHAQIYSALTRIKLFKDYSLRENTAQSDLEVSVFSDSIVISGASDNVQGVVWSAAHLQCGLLALGILVRGGISRGRTIHADDILYGEGMLQAHYLESKAAIYPRIVLDPKLLDDLTPMYRAMLLSHDSDGLWFIDPFSVGVLPGNSEDMLERGCDPYEESLKMLGKKMDQELSRLSDVGQIAKWTWLKTRHGIAVLEFAEFGKPRFWHLMEKVEKLKKTTTSADVQG